MLPNGVLVVEKIPAKRLINDHDPRIIQVVMLRKDASLKQRNSHCVKIIGANVPEIGRQMLTWRQRRFFFDDELSHVHIVLAEGNKFGECGGLNTGHGLDVSQKPLEGCTLLPRFPVR